MSEPATVPPPVGSRAALQIKLRLLSVPDPSASVNGSSHLTEDGFGWVNVDFTGETSFTQVICLQVGQRPEGL